MFDIIDVTKYICHLSEVNEKFMNIPLASFHCLQTVDNLQKITL